MNKQSFYEVLRFGVVGCIAVAVQYGVYYLLLRVLGHNISFAIGYFVSFAVNYLLTTSFTFKTQKSIGNGIGFIICHLINFLLQVGLLNLFIYIGLRKEIAPIPVLAICVPTNFFLVRAVMKKY